MTHLPSAMPTRWTLALVAVLQAALHMVTPAAAQPTAAGEGSPPYVHDAWRTEHGLPHNSVSAILQTRDGYLWIGTAAGLVRFNGHRFTPATGASHLDYAYVWTLHEAADGALWVGAGDGLTRAVGAETVTFTTDDGLPVDFVRAVVQDEAGAMWAGTYGGGVCRLDGGDATCTTDGLPGPFVTALSPGRGGALWVGTDGGLAVRRGGRFRPVAASAGLRDVTALREDARGTLWVGTRTGLFRLRGDSLAPVLDGRRALGPVHALLDDSRGVLWIGTEDAGLYQLRADTLTRPTLDLPLAARTIRALHEDGEGNLWIGSHGDGVIRLKPGRARVYGAPEGLSGDVTTTVLEARDGTVWVGTESGLSRIRAGTAAPFSLSERLPTSRILSLAEDPSGGLWIGTDGGGLSRFDGGGLTTLTTRDGLPSDAVYALYVDPDGSLWAGTDRGVSRIQEGRVRTFTASDGLAPGIVTAFASGADGALWIGADGGLSRFDGAGFTTFTTEDGLPTDLVRSLHVDARGTLWIGTRGEGLVRLRDGAFTTFTTRHGLPDAIIYAILRDDRGHLWLSTGRRGLARLPLDALDAVADGRLDTATPLLIDEGDGLRSAEMNGGYHPAAWRARDGRLWFTSHDGVAVVDPAAVDDDAPPPPIRIEGVQIDERPVPFADGAVTVPASARRLDIHYASLSFRDPDRTRYRYHLGGADDAWVPTDQWSREYLQLQPGTYTFEVAAANAEGVWSTPPARLHITVLPPWWRTWWAYGVYALLVGFAVSSLVRWRMVDLRRRNEALETLVAERTAEVARQAERLAEVDAVKSRFFADLSHEFRTPLTLILGPLDDLLASPDAGRLDRETVAVMRRQARRLLLLIDQLLDLAKLEAGRLHLRARRHDLVRLLGDVVLSFAPAADAKDIALEFQPATDDLDAYVDRDKMEHVVYNLLANALKFTDAGGKVHVSVRRPRGEAAAEILVRDTGSGIPPDQLDRIFDRFHQSATGGVKGTGIGLALVRELVQLHGGTVRVESTVGFGSTFIIWLPLGRDHLGADDLAGDLAGEDSLSGDASPAPTEIVEAEIAEAIAVPAGPAEAPAGAPHVLVVEDDPDVRAYLRRCLTPNFRVSTAADGADGLARVRADAPDLVISDVRMPVMDGFELTRRLKGDPDLRHLPLILLTARASAEARLEGLGAGADDYLAKPFNAEELRARVHNLVDVRRRLREKFSGEVVLRPSGVAVPSAEAAFLERAVEVVEAHLSDSQFGVGALADEVGLSARQLQRRLRDLTHESPSHFIRRIRLERAAQLLAQRAATVSEVAYAVGFSKPGYFSKLFAKAYGVPPSEYAPLHSEDEPPPGDTGPG